MYLLHFFVNKEKACFLEFLYTIKEIVEAKILYLYDTSRSSFGNFSSVFGENVFVQGNFSEGKVKSRGVKIP